MRDANRPVYSVAFLGSIITAALLLFAPVAWSEAVKTHYDIPPQPLASALKSLAETADLQLVFSPQIVAGKQTQGVRGDYTALQALEALIGDSGLTYSFDGKDTIVIHLRRSAEAPDTATNAASDQHASSISWRLAQAYNSTPGTAEGSAASDSSAEKNKRSEPASQQSALEEVIVTAQKRSERLQDVPVSITVLNGTALDSSRYAGVADALASVPGVSLTAGDGSGLFGGGAQIAVRGVTASGSVLAGASPVGYYIDSVPFGLLKSAITPDTSAYDLQRVEVLRGPQGTLYGASAEGGLVRILTNDADLNNFDFKARASVSTTEGGGGNHQDDFMANLPIVDGKLAARVVLGDEHWSGWINSPTQSRLNDGDARNARLKIDARPTDELSIGLSAWHSQTQYGGLSASLENRTTTTTFPTPSNVGYNAFGLKVVYEFEAATLSSNTSYLNFNSSVQVDLAALGFPVGSPLDPLSTFISERVWSEELLLNSKQAGPWQWTIGAYFRNDQDQWREYANSAVLPEPELMRDGSKSSSIFGELSRRFFHDKLQWTLGGRYFHDNENSSDFGPIYPGAPPYYKSAAFNPFTPRAVLTWYPSKTLTAYASFSEGFRSGGPQQAAVAQTPGIVLKIPPVSPDRLYNYEIGSKGTLFDGHLLFDTAIFYMKWKDVQQLLNVTFATVNGANATVAALVNGQSASGPGAEFAVQVLPFKGLEIGLNAAWNDLKFDTPVYSGGVLAFAQGERLNASPEYTAGASIQYSFALGDSGFKAHLAATDRYTSRQYQGVSPTTFSPVAFDPIMVSSASFSVDAPSHWTGTLYVDNLNNERRAPYGFEYTTPDWYERLRPRTVGVQLEYHLR